MKRTSYKLPAFSGRCRAGQLVETANECAAKAMNPTKASSRAADAILYALAVLLLLAGLTHCTPARQATQQRHHEEHAAPNPHGWYWD